MKIDIISQIGLVTREVRERTHEERPARVVVASRTYDTSVEDLWDAITSAERIPRWFLPVSGELRLGGRYQLRGNAGGTITRCDAPHQLALTWEFGGEVSWVHVQLTRDGDGARLELEHIAHVGGDFWDRFGPGAVGVGWDLALTLGLVQHLRTGEAVDPKAAEAWTLSPEGKEFVRLCSDDWCRASIAAGTPEAAATAAAARTTAFYTGETGEPQAG
jgi:uncharacterized protein YndB with AHSA1/START domain